MLFDINIVAASSAELANQTPSLALTQRVESLLQEFALLLKIILEFIAISIIAISLIIALQKLWQKARRKRLQEAQQAIRLELGLSLALALEFLLAADIAATAVSPSWDAIAQLAAITGIRTFLNFFLQKEVHELEALNQKIRENAES